MRSMPSLLSKLKQDFSDIRFEPGEKFHWSPENMTILYADESDELSLLHEVAHAALGHSSYSLDIELIKLERAAWDRVVSDLAQRYKVAIDSQQIESMIDTYRDWLHDRSLCPTCQATGIQSGAKLYTCLACGGKWRVNEARLCSLRRYKIV